MSTDAIAFLGFVALFVLMLLRVPVGMAMGLVGVTGYSLDRRRRAGAQAGRPDLDAHGHRLHLRRDPDVHADGRVRLGVGREPRAVQGRQRVHRPSARRARHRDGRRPAAASRRSAARRSRPRRPSPTVAYPEMRRFGYPQSFSTGVIAAGGTLGAMLPPSTVLAVYAHPHAAGHRQAVHGRHPARACSRWRCTC